MSILSTAEATAAIGEQAGTVDSLRLADTLAAIDAHITATTGYVIVSPADATVRLLARMLLVHWWDNPDGFTESANEPLGITCLTNHVRNAVDVAAEE